jgi:hypothetical protein
MAQADRDGPIEPPAPEPVAADESSEIAVYQREIARLRAQLAEREARDAPNWQPLKRACFNLDMQYRKGRDWAARAIAEGRSSDAIKIGGKVVVNQTALRAFRDLKPPPG